MESANLYQQHHQLQLQQQEEQQKQQQHRQLFYSSLAISSSSSPHVVLPVQDQWNPSILLDGDEFNRCINEILPNSRECFWPKNITNLDPSVRNSVLEAEDIKSCDFRSYVLHPMPNKMQFENVTKGNISDGFFFKQKFSADSLYPNAENFMRFAGLASSPSNYISSCSRSSTDHDHNLYVSTSSMVQTSSPSLLPLVSNVMNCRNYDDEDRSRPFEERMSSAYFYVQHSSNHNPSNNSNKTSTFRKEVTSATKDQKSIPNHEVAKKARVTSQSSCPTLKVRKEKLGDRIAALHRLVSPFGKTDTATVLTEAIGYIHFLQDQIQSLSMSYLKSSRSKSCRMTRGELMSMKEHKYEEQRPTMQLQDLRSRGLCLAPVAFTSYVCCSDLNGSI